MPARPSTVQRRRERLAAARVVMRQRLADPDLDLSDIAAAVGCSTRQLQRLCAELGGADFRSTLLQMRMRRAKRLLETGRSVRAVAPRVGYRGASGLVGAFKRAYGVPPSAVQPRTPEYLGSWRSDATMEGDSRPDPDAI